MYFKHVACVSVVLLLVVSLFGFLPVAGEVSPEVAIAEYNYYFVAGHNMTPTPPSPRSSPPSFLFSADPPVYDMGTVYHHGGRDYLYDGFYESGSPVDDNAYVTVNITNLLGYDITILDLTAEVTAGTPTKHWWFSLDGVRMSNKFSVDGLWLGNVTMVAVDTLDPWDPTADPGAIFDEVNYTTGAVQVHSDPYVHSDPFGEARGYVDWFRKATGDQGWPYMVPWIGHLGPGSLLENDPKGDAAATGHVKPVMLANGTTLTEYVGFILFGEIAIGTQIDATITFRLTYKPHAAVTIPPVCDVSVINVVPLTRYWDSLSPLEYPTIETFPTWDSLPINVILRNWGNLPITVTVNAYYGKDGGWFQIGTSKVVSLDPPNGTILTFYWNLEASNLSKAVYPIKVVANATNGSLTDIDEFIFNVKSRVLGDTDGDNDVDVADQRKLMLVIFEGYNSWPIFTDMDGDWGASVLDLIIQKLHTFETWPGPTGSAGISRYSPADSIGIDPPTATVQVGQTITVNVIITNITYCFGYMMKIDYNSTLLKVVSWTFDTGTPLTSTQIAPALGDRVDTDMSFAGSVQLATVWKRGIIAYNGSGVAAKITFNGTMVGNFTFVFDQFWTKACDRNGDDILSAEFNDGSVTVTITGDVDGNRRVDVCDQRLVQLAMFTMPGYPNWNPNADIDGDGDVDVVDQVIQQLHMFESW